MIAIFENARSALLLILLGLFAVACSTQPDASSIINKAIEKHGGKAFENSRIGFDFRGVRYTALRQNGKFVFTRHFPDSLSGITDSLTNKGFSRTIAGAPAQLTADEDSMYSNSVNSVIYFALLPYKLNDPAVNKKLLGETTINGAPYYEIEVTFEQQGGGTDYQDRYIYWIHRKDYTMDHLAYRFHVEEGGTRFREAQNVRTIKGIRFADYNNFGSPEMQKPLQKYDSYFKADTLNKISEVNLDSIEVRVLD